jgi:hypothetical protein
MNKKPTDFILLPDPVDPMAKPVFERILMLKELVIILMSQIRDY